MKIIRNIKVPTGNICVMSGDRGNLEFLSVGDYGKDEAADDTIHRVLGTICMICVAKDKRKWVYVEDADKSLKLSKDKIPDPNQYFIGDYRIPKPKK